MMVRRGEGIGPPIIFITLVNKLNTYDLGWGEEGVVVRNKERQ